MGRGMAQPVYKLGDAFAARQAVESLELLAGLLDDGEAGPRLLATLHRALRQIRGVKALQQRRASRDEMIKRLGLMPFKVGDVLQAAGALVGGRPGAGPSRPGHGRPPHEEQRVGRGGALGRDRGGVREPGGRLPGRGGV